MNMFSFHARVFCICPPYNRRQWRIWGDYRMFGFESLDFEYNPPIYAGLHMHTLVIREYVRSPRTRIHGFFGIARPLNFKIPGAQVVSAAH